MAQFNVDGGNITCAILGDNPNVDVPYTRCDIAEKSWTVTKPADCELDYGNGLEVGDDKGAVTCAGDTVLSNNPELPPRSSIVNADFFCDWSGTELTCVNTSTSHGFTMSRTAYKVF